MKPINLLLNIITYKKIHLFENAIDGDITLYEDDSAKNLIVWFNGGSFHTTDRRTSFGFLNDFINASKAKYDIITFDYHIRFKYTVHDSIVNCQQVIAKFLQKKAYKQMHAIGILAGVMLAGAYQTNEIN